MKVAKMILVALSFSSLFSCFTARVVGKDPAPEYFKQNFGAELDSTQFLILNRLLHERYMNLFKEAVLNDSSLDAAQKEEQYKLLREFDFESQRYVSLIFVLKNPVPFHMRECKLELADESGEEIIDSVIFQSVKEILSSKYGTQVDYDYMWILKLKKSFNKANYRQFDYRLKFAFPDGGVATYSVVPGEAPEKAPGTK